MNQFFFECYFTGIDNSVRMPFIKVLVMNLLLLAIVIVSIVIHLYRHYSCCGSRSDRQEEAPQSSLQDSPLDSPRGVGPSVVSDAEEPTSEIMLAMATPQASSEQGSEQGRDFHPIPMPSNSNNATTSTTSTAADEAALYGICSASLTYDDASDRLASRISESAAPSLLSIVGVDGEPVGEVKVGSGSGGKLTVDTSIEESGSSPKVRRPPRSYTEHLEGKVAELQRLAVGGGVDKGIVDEIVAREFTDSSADVKKLRGLDENAETLRNSFDRTMSELAGEEDSPCVGHPLHRPPSLQRPPLSSASIVTLDRHPRRGGL